MENKVTFKYEIKQDTKTTLKVFRWVFLFLAIGALIASVPVLFTDAHAIAIITIFMTICFFSLAKVSANQLNTVQRMNHINEFREKEIYHLYENYDQNIKKEHTITYDQVKTIYLARGTNIAYNHSPNKNRAVYPILIIAWENEGKNDYVAQGMTGNELSKALDLIPDTIPLKAIEYDMTHITSVLYPKVLETSDLIEISREKPVKIPFQIIGRVSSLPSWELPEQKEKKEKREKRSKWIYNAAIGFTVVLIFLITLFIMPNLELVDDTFRIEDTIYIDLSYSIVLFLFVFLRHSIIYKGLYPIKKALLHALLISGTFIAGGILANALMTVPNGFIDAIVIHAMMAVLFIGAFYVFYVLVGMLWIFMSVFGVKKQP